MVSPQEQQPQSAPFELLRVQPLSLRGAVSPLEWDTDHALEDVLKMIEGSQEKKILAEAAEFAKPRLEKRWQIGFKPILRYEEEGITAHVPSIEELGKNNRYLHSLEAVRVALILGQACRVPNEGLFLLGIGLLFHDYMHPVFSHVGESFIQSVSERVIGSDPEFYYELEALGLGRHETRLVQEARDPHSQLGSFLLKRFSPQQINVLETVWREQGVLGQIASLADTIAYLNKDSLFFGYKPPHFEDKLRRVLKGFGRFQTIDLLIVEKNEAIRDVLSYRDALYKLQYFAPLNQLIQNMQIEMLWDYVASLPSSSSRTRRASDLTLLISRSDEEMLKLLRRRSLICQRTEGVGIFGIPAEITQKVNQIPEQILPHNQEEFILMQAGHPSKSITIFETATRSIKTVPPPLPSFHVEFRSLFGVKRGDASFWEQMDPILRKLCKLNARAQQKGITPEAIQTFMRSKYLNRVPVSDFNVDDQNRILDVFHILETDFSYDYPLPPVLQNMDH